MFTRIYAAWRDLMDNKSDPRTADWPLMSSPIPTILICLTYVLIVKVKELSAHSLLISFIGVQILGPKFMEKRKPFKLRKIIVTYNLLQAIASFYLFFEAGRISWFGRYNWRCAAVDFSNDEYAMRVIACLIGQFLNDNCPSNVF